MTKDIIINTILSALSLAFAYLLREFVSIQQYIIALLILVAIDFFTGVRAAKKRGEIINSKGLRRTAVKFKDYFLAILSCKVVQDVFMQDIPLIYAVSSFIALVELKSILENIETTQNIQGLSGLISLVRGFRKKN